MNQIYTTRFNSNEINNWNQSLSFPLLQNQKSADLLKTFGKSPSLSNHRDDGWIASPYTEMNATTHKHYVEFDLDRCRENFWKVYKGESYDLWQPDPNT